MERNRTSLTLALRVSHALVTRQRVVRKFVTSSWMLLF